MWFNKNAGNPNAWTVDFDKSRPAFTDGVDRNGIGAHHVAGRRRATRSISTGPSSTTPRATSAAAPRPSTPEASGRSLFQPSHMQQATWSSPVTSRILLEAGWGTYQARYRNPEPRQDGSHNDRMIRTTEQTANLAAIVFLFFFFFFFFLFVGLLVCFLTSSFSSCSESVHTSMEGPMAKGEGEKAGERKAADSVSPWRP